MRQRVGYSNGDSPTRSLKWAAQPERDCPDADANASTVHGREAYAHAQAGKPMGKVVITGSE